MSVRAVFQFLVGAACAAYSFMLFTSAWRADPGVFRRLAEVGIVLACLAGPFGTTQGHRIACPSTRTVALTIMWTCFGLRVLAFPEAEMSTNAIGATVMVGVALTTMVRAFEEKVGVRSTPSGSVDGGNVNED